MAFFIDKLFQCDAFGRIMEHICLFYIFWSMGLSCIASARSCIVLHTHSILWLFLSREGFPCILDHFVASRGILRLPGVGEFTPDVLQSEIHVCKAILHTLCIHRVLQDPENFCICPSKCIVKLCPSSQFYTGNSCQGGKSRIADT